MTTLHCRNEVQPDAHFYAVLIEVAGVAGDLEKAQKFYADAKAHMPEQQVKHPSLSQAFPQASRFTPQKLQPRVIIVTTSNLGEGQYFTVFDLMIEAMQNSWWKKVMLHMSHICGMLSSHVNGPDLTSVTLPSQALQSALIQACIECSDLGKARELYSSMRADGQVPTLKAFNSLINAYGRAMRLGDTVSLVKDLVSMGIRPDMRTFAAILGACQRANEPELAFEVYRWSSFLFLAMTVAGHERRQDDAGQFWVIQGDILCLHIAVRVCVL